MYLGESVEIAIPELPECSVSRNLSDPLQLAAKRGFDVLASLLLIALLFPIIVLEALLIWLTSGSPILFRWHVVGLDGRPFIGYKFRTMIVGADGLRKGLENQNEMTGPFFKMRNDPRVTRLGRILRRFSLDELPQLWSILIGDMSFVGPRPTQTFEFEQLDARQRARTLVRPGAISQWIVSGKSSCFEDMIELDLQYISQWSFWTDIQVLCKALPYVVFGKNF